jgi:hypothetical protein
MHLKATVSYTSSFLFRHFRFILYFLFGGAIASLLFGASEENRMLARQSNNIGIPVLPAAGDVTIDGTLDEWDLSGQIWSFADVAIRDTYSVRTAAMWDQDALYIAATWQDPTPMFSAADPVLNPQSGWKSDAMQLRFHTGGRTFWLTTWYYAERQEAVLHIETWKVAGKPRGENTIRVLISEPGEVDLGEGIQIAYREGEDGKSFVQEMKFPRDFIFGEGVLDAFEAGVSFNLGLEFLWGDITGAGYPDHRYADNLMPGETSREFFWNAYDVWGPAVLQSEGDLKPFQYVPTDWRITGTIPIRLDLPADARRFTVVVDDANGHRVRNLGADLDPADYTVRMRDDRIDVEVLWDGLDDDGVLVEPGNYFVRGLTHDGLSAYYDVSYYGPGSPPWRTSDSSSAWLGDHSDPWAVASYGDWTFVSVQVAEGGDGLIGIDREGNKCWGEHRGATALAATEDYLYALGTSFTAGGDTLWRYTHDGDFAPFELNGTMRSFDFSLTNVLGLDEIPGRWSAIAVYEDTIVLGCEGHPTLYVLDAQTAELKGQVELAGEIRELHYSQTGVLYGIVGNQVCMINPKNGATKVLTLQGMVRPRALTLDENGLILVYDDGADNQVKAYRPDGALEYTIGKTGGRPLRGKFESDGLRHVRSLSVDGQGLIWTVEAWHDPRRVTRWDRESGLVRDYLGGTSYSGTNSYLHESDPTLAYVGSVEMKLDRENDTYAVNRILWVPDAEKNEAFDLWTQAHYFGNPTFYVSDASGKERRYLYFNGQYSAYQAFYVERGDSMAPVSAITTVEYLTRELPNLDLAGMDAKTGVFWNDANRDAAVSKDELSFVKGGLPHDNYWTSLNVGSDLSIYMCNGKQVVRYHPTGYTEEGAPLFNQDNIEVLEWSPNLQRGPAIIAPMDADDPLILMGYKVLGAYDMASGESLWSYPNVYHGVHASHDAPMPGPGEVVGSLKFDGFVTVNDSIGKVFSIRGNLGQEYFFTADGLMVGSLFRDSRLPRGCLPKSKAEAKGMQMNDSTLGSEPFNGWFGKQDDGKYRLLTPISGQSPIVVEIRGLDTVQRFTGPELSLSATQLRAAEQANAMSESDASTNAHYTIRRIGTAPRIDGKSSDWIGIDAEKIVSSASIYTGDFRLAYDDRNLYAFYTVTDQDPWLNTGKDHTILFKTGDAVDLQFGMDSEAAAERQDPVEGDLRIVVAPYGNGVAAVRMQPVDSLALERDRQVYESPVGAREFDRVQIMDSAQIAVSKSEGSYTVELAIPLSALDFSPAPGMQIRGDIGFISSDAEGQINTARTYWSNQNTSLVSDEPNEAWLFPAQWGTFVFE